MLLLVEVCVHCCCHSSHRCDVIVIKKDISRAKKRKKKKELTWGSRCRHISSPPVCPSTPAFTFVIPGIGVGNNADGGCSLLVLVVAWVDTVKMQCVRKWSIDLNQSHVMCEGQAEITYKYFEWLTCTSKSPHHTTHWHNNHHHVDDDDDTRWWQGQGGGKRGGDNDNGGAASHIKHKWPLVSFYKSYL